MALAANAIVSLDEAKSFLGEQSPDRNLEIESRINGLSSIFDQRLGRKTIQQTLTDYRIDGNGSYRATLPWTPVQSVSKVEIRLDRQDLVYKTITDASKWVLKEKRSGVLEMIEDVLICGYRNILVTMQVGFAASDWELSSIKKLFLDQLHFEYHRWQKNEIGVQNKNLLDGSIGWIPAGGLLREIDENLELFRDRRIL